MAGVSANTVVGSQAGKSITARRPTEPMMGREAKPHGLTCVDLAMSRGRRLSGRQVQPSLMYLGTIPGARGPSMRLNLPSADVRFQIKLSPPERGAATQPNS